MASRRLTAGQIDTLAFQTTQVYDAFLRAVKQKSNVDILWAVNLGESLLGSLKEITDYFGGLTWRRDTKQAAVFDRYALQYVLNASAHCLYKDVQFIPTDLQFDSVKAMIDAKNHRYLNIKIKVQDLARAQKFGDVVQLFDYVRAQYPCLNVK